MIRTTITRRIYLPEGVREPQTVKEAIFAARRLLEEEESRWTKHTWFKRDESADPDEPFCGNWKVCMMGALRLVTMGVSQLAYTSGSKHDEESYHKHWHFSFARRDEAGKYDKAGIELYQQAEALVNDETRHTAYNGVNFNDRTFTRRQDVLNLLKAAEDRAA